MPRKVASSAPGKCLSGGRKDHGDARGERARCGGQASRTVGRVLMQEFGELTHAFRIAICCLTSCNDVESSIRLTATSSSKEASTSGRFWAISRKSSARKILK